MSLASRLSAFFLAAPATVLVGFSATLFAPASDHLHRQVDERLDAVLATLAAAAEVGPGAVEWDPRERELGLGRDDGADQIRWVVRDDRGRLVDQSANLNPRRLTTSLPPGFTGGRLEGHDGRPWWARIRRVTSRGLTTEDHDGVDASPSPSDVAHASPGYAALTLWLSLRWGRRRRRSAAWPWL